MIIPCTPVHRLQLRRIVYQHVAQRHTAYDIHPCRTGLGCDFAVRNGGEHPHCAGHEIPPVSLVSWDKTLGEERWNVEIVRR